MPAPLHITGSRHPRPASARTVYCDGSHDEHYRAQQDLELSHWVPNVTAPAYKADTSTGVVLRYLDAGAPGGYDLVVNDHVDTDGVIASWLLLQPERALPHRERLLRVAAVGDFAAWAEPAELLLYQRLVVERERLRAAQVDPVDRALALHRLLLARLEDPAAADEDPARDGGVAAVQRAVQAIEQGRIERELLAPRLVHYRVPLGMAATPDDAIEQPRLDQPLHPAAVLPPVARSRLDAEGLQLVSTERERGRWTHDLCWPSYAWADTVTLWRPPGMRASGGENEYGFELPALRRALAALTALERGAGGAGAWQMAERVSVFEALPGRWFPVVLSFMNEGRAAASTIAPADVARLLHAAVADAP